MRINISAKLFLGFLVVIFLNIFFVVVVSKVSDLKNIAEILERQNEIKSGMLQVASFHDDQKRLFIFVEDLQRRESIETIKNTGRMLRTLLDTLAGQMRAIVHLDTLISQTDESGNRMKILELNHLVADKIRDADALYLASIEQYATSSVQTVTMKQVESVRTARKMIQQSSDSLEFYLDLAESLIDTQTRMRLGEIAARIDNVKKITLIILVTMTAFALLFGLVFSRAMSNSLRRLKVSAGSIAKGDFTFDPSGYPGDEIGDLAQAFFDMAMDLKHVQEQLVKSKRLAAIGEIVASVNHEINNPLMIISGNAQFLEMMMESYPQDLKDRVKAILEETERISQVTRKLREIKNPVVEDYTSSGEQMINLDKSTK